MNTPWGQSQHVKHFGPDIFSVSTAGHGGFKVEAKANLKIPFYMREADGWYEEDCDWAVVAVVFPDLFTAEDHVLAKKTLASWKPDAYERYFEVTLKPGESHTKDERAFYKAHADALIDEAMAMLDTPAAGWREAADALRPLVRDALARRPNCLGSSGEGNGAMNAKQDGAPPDAGREFNEVLGKAFRMVQQISVLADQAGEVGAKALQAELGQAWRAILKAHAVERRSKAGGLTYDAAGRAIALQDDGRIPGGDQQKGAGR
jgi:hypothetical protein